LSKKIGIIGAGPAGLSVASLLPRDYDVWVFEEHKEVGLPKHCTGVVSLNTARFYEKIAGNKIISNKYLGVHIYADNKYLNITSPRPMVFRIDRPLLEKKLYDYVLAKGFNIVLNSSVKKIRKNGDNVVTVLDQAEYVFDKIVVAEGSKRRIAHSLGCRKTDYIYGIQYLVRARGIDASSFYVLFTKFIPEFFLWLVPIDNDVALLGYGYNYRPFSLDLLKNIVWKRMRIAIGECIDSFGGLIPIGTPCKPTHFNGKIYLIGDALPFTKPFSGGGLYGICYLAPYLVESITSDDHGIYEKIVHDKKKSLQIPYLIRNISLKLGGQYTAVKILIALAKVGLKIDLENYDMHERIFFKSIPIMIGAPWLLVSSISNDK